MFDKNYEEQLILWSEFRNHLEQSQTPLEDTVSFYSTSPNSSLNTDPWDQACWPSPWELLQENQYCSFTRVLGYCFSLQLTERFTGSEFEIHISTDDEKGYLYHLVLDKNWALGSEKIILTYEKFAKKYKPHLVYDMTNCI
jgi:hypothetical protein